MRTSWSSSPVEGSAQSAILMNLIEDFEKWSSKIIACCNNAYIFKRLLLSSTVETCVFLCVTVFHVVFKHLTDLLCVNLLCNNIQSKHPAHTGFSLYDSGSMLSTQPRAVHILISEKPISFLCFIFKFLLYNLLLHSCILFYIPVLVTNVHTMQAGSHCTECCLCCDPGPCASLQGGAKKEWL